MSTPPDETSLVLCALGSKKKSTTQHGCRLILDSNQETRLPGPVRFNLLDSIRHNSYSCFSDKFKPHSTEVTVFVFRVRTTGSVIRMLEVTRDFNTSDSSLCHQS